jgi:hypothetical protein
MHDQRPAGHDAPDSTCVVRVRSVVEKADRGEAANVKSLVLFAQGSRSG